MSTSRVLIFAVALCVTATIANADQGQRAGRESGRAAAAPPSRIAEAPGAARAVSRPHGDRTIAENIARDPKIEARVKEMLPPGMTLEEASDGFRNQGQFVATLQASKNLDIDFADLKAEMTSRKRLTLGEAIQKLKP